jgi:excisionase family DNA binding protein
MTIDPIFIPIKQASEILGRCHRSIYEMIATNKLRAVKSGGRTLVVYASVLEYADSLPAPKLKPDTRVGRHAKQRQIEAV